VSLLEDILRELIPAAAIHPDRKAELLDLLNEADDPEAKARVEARAEAEAERADGAA
jgi:hypothetical protein